MRDIVIAADDYVLAFLPELLAVLEHRLAERELIRKPGVLALAVGKVGIDQGEVRKIRLQHPPLGVDLRYAQALADLERLFLRKDRDPAIAGLLGRMPVGMVLAGP